MKDKELNKALNKQKVFKCIKTIYVCNGWFKLFKVYTNNETEYLGNYQLIK